MSHKLESVDPGCHKQNDLDTLREVEKFRPENDLKHQEILFTKNL